ncbi:MAG: 2-C-methyl-D-erythritol 4-phosphate cytidylyltransferase, partial [Undibacterium sp.]|nr:2-C-methyl-D-erythritol 4-phosphate cytidylyltransferase [Undibacterium sp.]
MTLKEKQATQNPQANRDKHIALIPAAGVGARMQSQVPKQYLPLSGSCVLQLTLNRFLACAQIDHTYVVVSPDDPYIASAVKAHQALTVLRCGGKTRAETVINAL